MRKGYVILAVFMMIFPVTGTVFAENLGTYGQTWAIAEDDMLAWIQAKIRKMQHNGEMQALQQRWQRNTVWQADRPLAVAGLRPTTHSATHFFDPSITLQSDLHDAMGNVFAKAGTRVNPLTLMHPASLLIFFDADDRKQMRWAENIAQQSRTGRMKKIKIVLVRGSVSKTAKILDQQIYFDQSGRLTEKFGIKQIPAIVRADGLRLRIDEVKP